MKIERSSSLLVTLRQAQGDNGMLLVTLSLPKGDIEIVQFND